MNSEQKKYEICINDIQLNDSVDTEDIKNFFSNIMENFAEESFRFHKEWGEFPFVYKERQVNSALIPAIYKYTETIWLEQPFKKEGNEQRYLDIATAKGKNIYLIELKHSFNSKTKNIDERTWNEWNTVIEQISTIKSDTLGEHYTRESNIFKIALMIMPKYLNDDKDNNEILSDYNKHIYNIFNDSNELYQRGYANFVGTIQINEASEYKHECSYGTQIYPFVSFIARIEKLVKK